MHGERMGSRIKCLICEKVLRIKKELSFDNSFLAPFAGLEPATL